VSIVPPDRAIAEESGRLKVEMRRNEPDVPLSDAVVYHTARPLGADVLTGDPHFRGLRGSSTSDDL
jgi:predicted nucleic acid-binding protein